MTVSWFAARFMSGYELSAAIAINHEQRSFCPVERRRWINKGTRHEKLYPILTGYVFIEMHIGDAYRWYEAKDQRGFLGFIGSMLAPAPIRAGIVEDLMARADPQTWEMEFEELDQRSSRPSFDRGDCVRIRDGTRKASTLVDLEHHRRR